MGSRNWVIGLAVMCIMVSSILVLFIPEKVEGSNGAILYVGGSGIGNYTTIQAAVNAANDGDTIKVWPNTYRENIVVDKEVRIVGDPFLDAMGGTGFTVTADNVTIAGFDIINASYGINCSALGFFFANNTINATVDGIHVFLHDIGCNLTGNSTFSRGDSTITNVTVTAGVHGIYLDANYWGCNLSGGAVVDIGMVNISGNTVSCVHGIRIFFHTLGCNLTGGSNFTMGDFWVSDNIISASDEGIRCDTLSHWGRNLSHGAMCTFRDFLVTDNVITAGNDSDDDGIYVFKMDWHGSDMNNSSSFLMGDIKFSRNWISAGDDGIVVDESDNYGEDIYNGSSFAMGNIEFCRNNVTAGQNGFWFEGFERWGNTMYNSSFVMGSMLVNDNVIDAVDDGIYVDELEWHGRHLYNGSSFVRENIEFCRNSINTTVDEGMDFYEVASWGEYMYHSSFLMGDFLVNDNVIDSGGDGINVRECERIGSHLYNGSSFVMRNIEFCRNTISAVQTGFWFVEFDQWGQDMDNSSFLMDDFVVNDNVITAAFDGIYFEELDSHGQDLYKGSVVVMGDTEFCGNQIIAGLDGMDFEDGGKFGYNMHDSSRFVMGGFRVNDNTLTCGESGIVIDELEKIGYLLYDNASVVVGNMEFNRNMITITSSEYGIFLAVYNVGSVITGNAALIFGGVGVNYNTILNAMYGIFLDNTDNVKITHNRVSDGAHGIFLQGASNNRIMYNKLINNTYLINLHADSGVHIDVDSHDNWVFMNCFFDNLYQGYDDGQGNIWRRNFWSDFPVGGGVYLIEGGAFSSDDNTLGQCQIGSGGLTERVPLMTSMGTLVLISVISLFAILVLRQKRN